jgi:hypothetical protein
MINAIQKSLNVIYTAFAFGKFINKLVPAKIKKPALSRLFKSIDMEIYYLITIIFFVSTNPFDSSL